MLTSHGIQHCQGTTSLAGPTPRAVGADKVEGEGGVKHSPFTGGEKLVFTEVAMDDHLSSQVAREVV